MTNYRRNFVSGGTYFFTVNLADRRLRLLTDHIDLLRAAFRDTRTRHPFAIDAIVILPDHLHAMWTLPDEDRDFATPKANTCRPVESTKASAEFGSADTGNIPCETRGTTRGTPTTFTSIPSSTAM
jgi:REP element-mobilizing transposase RayT